MRFARGAVKGSPSSPLPRRYLVWCALKHHARHDGNWILSRPSRVGHTFKAVAAVLLGRDTIPPGDAVDWSPIAYRPDPVTVAYVNGGSYSSMDGTVHWFEELIVPKGWRGWCYEINQDSS